MLVSYAFFDTYIVLNQSIKCYWYSFFHATSATQSATFSERSNARLPEVFYGKFLVCIYFLWSVFFMDILLNDLCMVDSWPKRFGSSDLFKLLLAILQVLLYHIENSAFLFLESSWVGTHFKTPFEFLFLTLYWSTTPGCILYLFICEAHIRRWFLCIANLKSFG